jgi:hypothetical protein
MPNWEEGMVHPPEMELWEVQMTLSQTVKWKLSNQLVDQLEGVQ